MPELAKKTFGTKLKRGEAYVAKLLNITPPEMNRDDIDVTNHDSPDEYREYIPGLKDGGEVPIQGHLIPGNTTQASLLAALDINEPEEWSIEFPSDPACTVTFMGYVKAFKVGDAPIDGTMTFTATIKVTSKPVLDALVSAELDDLVVTGSDANPVTIVPDFDGGVHEYFASVGNGITYVTVTPEGAGILSVNGAVVASTTASQQIALAAEAFTSIVVKAKEASKVAKTYTIKIYRAGE